MQYGLRNSLQTGHIICVLEGNAEEAIIKNLFDNNKLIFKKGDLSEEGKLVRDFTQIRKAERIAEQYLTRDYGEDHINILRILDSKKEKFILPRIYNERVADKSIRVFDILTRPEIEILIIINEEKYDEFTNRRGSEKPSSYCKRVLGLKNIKSNEGTSCYFNDTEVLISGIKEYKRLHSCYDEYCLYDLLK